MFNLYLVQSASGQFMWRISIPVIFDCLDDETKSRADTVDVFIHDLLHDRSLSCIVKPTNAISRKHRKRILGTHSISIRISLSFRRALRRIESILSVDPGRLPLCLLGSHRSGGEKLDTTRLNLPEMPYLTTTTTPNHSDDILGTVLVTHLSLRLLSPSLST
jgi:hypothetical protein